MVPDKGVIPEDWYERSFDALYPVIYAHRTVEAAKRESRFAAERLDLCAGKYVLDLACGNGRHLVHLRACGARGIGLDYSAFLLGEATRLLGTSRGLVRADMRAIPFTGVFDAVVNFFTSFGYFLDRDDNLHVVQGVARALKPGGRFFIDYINADHAERHLVPVSKRTAEQYVIEESRWIEAPTRRINKCMTVARDGALLNRFAESVQLYSKESFVALLEEGGLHVEEVYGDYDGSPWGADQPRMIVLGTKARHA